MKLNFFIVVTALLIFTGCSSKHYYKPKVKVSGDYPISFKLKNEIVGTSFASAQLENNQIISKNRLLDYKLKKGYTFLNECEGKVLASNIEGNLTISDINASDSNANFNLKKSVAAATLSNDILAVLFADNEMALYSVTTKELLFKSSGGSVTAVDHRIVNPYFLDDLVLFLTLDGKVVIINTTTKEILRSSIVSSKENFNNVIYFNVVNNKLLAATTYKLLSIADDEKRQAYEMRDIIFNKDGIFLTTKQGEIVVLTPDLGLKFKKKFPFAHFLGMIVKDKIYLLEKEGYMIVLEKDLSSYKVYDVDIDDGYVYTSDNSFYFNNKAIKIDE